MSLILEALKQIEAREPEPQGKISDDAAVEAALARAEAVAELVGGDSVGNRICSVGDRICQPTSVADRVASHSTPLSATETKWPWLPNELHRQAYCELAERIVAQLPSDQAASLMFTSPCDGDGKTATLVGLAAAVLDRIGDGEILLIDCNFRAPELARRLGVEAAGGLADVLTGATTWQRAVRRTVLPRLSVLPGHWLSTPWGRPPELLDLEPLLTELSDHYPLVLLDTPSLTHGETAPIGRFCTGVYLVVRLGHTPRRAVREAAAVIRHCHGKLLGSIVLR